GDDGDGDELPGGDGEVVHLEERLGHPRQRQAKVDPLDLEQEVLGAELWHQDAEELAEDDGDGGDGAGLDDEKEGPAEEEAPQGRIRLPKVDMLPAGLGNHAGGFGVAEGADDGHEAGEAPDGEEPAGGADVGGDGLRGDEDARADHGADDEHG